jgi:hypothetical protein
MENFEERWARATDKTHLHRTRKHDLYTFGATRLPYIFLAESAINVGDTIVRRGEISTEKPAIFLGGSQSPRFEGFQDSEEDQKDQLLFARAFRFPGLNVQNQHMQMELVAREASALCDELMSELDDQRDSRTAVIEGPEDLWGLSLIFYAAQMTSRSAPGNMREMMERGGGPSLGY